MATQLSPGVNFTEYDLTNIVPSVSTSTGALAGIFGWGPVGVPTLTEDADDLKNFFTAPTNLNPETFFTAFNFLEYGNTLYVTRAANTSGATPYATFAAANASANTPSSTFVLASGNTNAITNGMYVAQTSNTAFVAPANNVSVQVVNSSAIFLSNANVTSNAQITLYFGNPGTSYSAVGLATNNSIVANLVNQIVANVTNYTTQMNTFDTNAMWIAKYPGGIGNSLRLSQCDSANAFSSNVALNGFANTLGVANSTTGTPYTGTFNVAIGANTASLVLTPGANTTVAMTNTVATSMLNQFSLGDQILFGNSSINYQYMQINSISPAVSNTTATTLTFNFSVPYRLHTPYSSNTYVTRYWEFYNEVGVAPFQSNWVLVNGNTAAVDQMHLVVVDDNGQFTGTPGTVLETYKNVSRATDCQNQDGSSNYYVNIINQNSKYVWWANDRGGATSANSYLVSSSTNQSPADYFFTLGTDGYSEQNAPLSILGNAYNTFASTEDILVDLVMAGYPAGGLGQSWQLGNYIIDNITSQRKDCVAFISPDKANVLNNYGAQAQSIVSWTNQLHSSSYAMVDTGYKYQYDNYNNVYRWIPLNGDIAGLAARCDATNAPWWSFGGFNRGEIKNLVRLAFNPKKADRDLLYTNGVNPVVTFPGQGTYLYGDKTFYNIPSAFNRINVRRLFIVLERAISLSAKYSLFEFNDAFTQAQFVNMVNPYLRNVMGQRGITDFLVRCDGTNNTAYVVDNNQFVGDIFVKPARAINFINLNFVAVNDGVQFATIENAVP